MDNETVILEQYLSAKMLKHSRQRKAILDVFLAIDRHLTAEEIYRLARRRCATVGVATVYRTMKMLAEAGLCRELKFDDGATRYEHLHGHRHHDHLVCTKCGRLVEVVDPAIERLQLRLAQRHGFKTERHRMEIYGLCRDCRR
ncbi:MAG: transcriptional repressor [Kiritimatiellia bacterium]|jgi:Fur family ferric uptake transcriptional regulator